MTVATLRILRVYLLRFIQLGQMSLFAAAEQGEAVLVLAENTPRMELST